MNITVGCKVDKETAQRLKEEALTKEVGVNHIMRELIYEHFEPKEEVWGGLYDDMLDELSGKLGKDAGWLLSVMGKIVEGGYLYVEDGKVILKEAEISQ